MKSVEMILAILQNNRKSEKHLTLEIIKPALEKVN